MSDTYNTTEAPVTENQQLVNSPVSDTSGSYESPETLSEATPDGEEDDLSQWLGTEDEAAETEEEGAPDASDFDAQFSAKFGFDVATAKTVFEDMQQQVADLQAQLANRQVYGLELELAQSWGIPYNETQERLVILRKEFDKLPDSVKVKYDSVDGAQKIWNQLQTKKATSRKPSHDKGQTAPPPSKYLYTESQIASMSDSDYAQHADRIQQAYNQGRVGK